MGQATTPPSLADLCAPCATTLEAAQHYVSLGLSVIPIRDKVPKISTWSPLRERLPTFDEVEEWFSDGLCSVAIVCGPVSRNLEVLDFDSDEAWLAWKKIVLNLRPSALDGLPIVRTPSGGHHVYYFRAHAGPNRKLARTSAKKTLIEVKGDGGYAGAPGSPPNADGKRYEWERTVV